LYVYRPNDVFNHFRNGSSIPGIDVKSSPLGFDFTLVAFFELSDDIILI